MTILDFPDAVTMPAPGEARLDRSIAAAAGWLMARQDAEGWWCGELEADVTLESYMVLLDAFLFPAGEPSQKMRALARVIRAEALPEGGFAQYLGGPPDLSVSCLAYLALKLAGDAAEAPHMSDARAAILRLGGAERANSYTKVHFALFGQMPWEAVPTIPPEMMFLPGRSPFTVYDMSSWSRTIFVPLSIVCASKPVRLVPPRFGAGELFGAAPPAATLGGASDGQAWRRLFLSVDRALKLWERLPGADRLRRPAVERAAAWVLERLPGSDGLGAILPAMACATLALHCLGYRLEHPLMRESLEQLDALLLRDDEGGLRMQPCRSPVWDTVLSTYALAQAGLPPDAPALRRAASWLLSKQTRGPGDWTLRNPAPPGGWYFEMRNEPYPDCDDTCMALIALRHARGARPARDQEAALQRGLDWLLGMQNDDGGWASFDRGNDKQWLTHVPFADHNAMIDPSTADITGRVLECLALFPGFSLAHPVVARARRFLLQQQTPQGSWYGRWGVNYLYGTWQVLRGLSRIGDDMSASHARRAAAWLRSRQNSDGGWGESIASYDDPALMGVGDSTPSQTAWAVMGLLAAGHADSAAVRRGIRWLLDRQDQAGTWAQEPWTGTGFPRVFYLNYHYYRHYFPLMAIAQYRARQ